MHKQSEPSPQPPTPQIIAHRGLCSIFPQNTKQAIIAGLHCSDYVQFDVMLTKDDQVIVFHDRALSRLTNIADFGQFGNRRCQMGVDGEKKVDWWVRDFLYEELSRLEVRQPCQYRPQLPRVFRISRLEEILVQCLKVKNRKEHKNRLHFGLLIQIKSQIANKTTPRDHQLCLAVTKLLQKHNLCPPNPTLPILLQSFNPQLIQSLLLSCSNNLIQLYNKKTKITYQLLKEGKNQRIIGIGVSWNSLMDQGGLGGKKGKGKISGKLGEMCRSLGYRLYFWVVRDDEHDEGIVEGFGGYQGVYRGLLEVGVQGFITEFPDKCKAIFNIESVQYPADKQQLAQKCLRKQPSTEPSSPHHQP